MNAIINVYVDEKEYDMFINLLGHFQNAKEDKDGNVLAMVKLDNKDFESLIGFCKKLTK